MTESVNPAKRTLELGVNGCDVISAPSKKRKKVKKEEVENRIGSVHNVYPQEGKCMKFFVVILWCRWWR